jgi:hypothetical protein
MPGTFHEGVEALKEMVGTGDLSGAVEFDQPYAWNQHEMGWLNFMGRYGPKPIREYHHGGGPKFLQAPMFGEAQTFLQHLADGLYEPEGLVRAMGENMAELAELAAAGAPFETGALKGSAHPMVLDDGVVVWDQPPEVPRKEDAHTGRLLDRIGDMIERSTGAH